MKKLIIYIVPMILLASCAKSLDDYNIDQKNPGEVPQGPLFSNALKELTDNVTSPSVNINVFRFWMQQWTATTYQDEPRYNFVTRNIQQNFWNPFYREVLHDLLESKRIAQEDVEIEEDVRNNQIAATEVASIYAWAALVNTYGDVPYNEALTDVNQPAYDNAEDIYADLLNRLDAAIEQIDPAAEGFGSADLLYGGDMSAWLKFAHSLKLRLAITLADIDEAAAQQAISASAASAFTSNNDNAAFAYQTSTPNNNPVSANLNSLFTTRQDYVAGRPFITVLNNLDDPRRPEFFTSVNGNYVGGVIGSNNVYSDNSSPSTKVIAPDFEALLMDYSEVEFILAEAAERWGILGSPEEHYNNAISASIIYWGGTQAQADTYLAQSEVAYGTAQGNWQQKIGTQKWIALYNRGFDAWNEWKRLDYPVLQPASGAVSPGIIPNRLTYPPSEYTLNESNVNEAVSRLGADNVRQKVFWDVN
ncbi:SusD/RagB family nutrient-binding outer membrane lipoprotein [Olivibacter sp. SDN3]|uniref:SusD/RagB family nutrient-binding outer membrane lipoprotein n=1 Tax=Olivibacter sp. SDN3 TaxID=2764720 RepID=UPI0016510635|nr:SusD/RagB family nutrient-binding outer membrane lipoprotein [Olivibacter sp. SDN3]QNL50842.1 SusD/RagB family nutrient-binding outer membrane lipoprotein [Olivibacter sp. SDN3]